MGRHAYGGRRWEYRRDLSVHISGTKGKEVGYTPLVGSSNVIDFWIDGLKVIGPNANGGTVTFWNYPAGGSGTKTIGGFDEPVGATVSTGE